MKSAPATWLPDPATESEALIKEARRRQRRRYIAAGVAVAAVLASAAGVLAVGEVLAISLRSISGAPSTANANPAERRRFSRPSQPSTADPGPAG